MNKAYSRINWQNDKNTALSAENLNKMDLAINELDDRIIELATSISGIEKFSVQIVSALPTSDISTSTIYLVLADVSDTNNLYSEYLYVNGAWEFLGSQTISLDGYATETYVQGYAQPKGEYVTDSELESKGYLTKHQDISGKADKATTLAGYGIADAYTATQVDEKVSELSDEIKDYQYELTDEEKQEIADIVKAEVPLVKSAEQPTIVSSVDEMTDTSKVYVLSTDGYYYNYVEGAITKKLTADDFIATSIGAYGNLETSYTNRIATNNLLSLTDNNIAVNCPSPYQYIVYYFSGDTATSSTYLGKTAFKNGSIDDVTDDTIASGTVSGATHCRISLRDSTDTAVSLSSRIDEFMANITITQSREGAEWTNTGLAYNQPADYEDRIIALESALEGIEYGSY